MVEWIKKWMLGKEIHIEIRENYKKQECGEISIETYQKYFCPVG